MAAQFVNELWDVYEEQPGEETTSLVFAGDVEEAVYELWSGAALISPFGIDRQCIR